MDKRIDSKVNRIIAKHAIASSTEELCQAKDNISKIYIEAGARRFGIPSKYFSLFVPAIEKMAEMGHATLMDELKAQEDYDG